MFWAATTIKSRYDCELQNDNNFNNRTVCNDQTLKKLLSIECIRTFNHQIIYICLTSIGFYYLMIVWHIICDIMLLMRKIWDDTSHTRIKPSFQNITMCLFYRLRLAKLNEEMRESDDYLGSNPGGWNNQINTYRVSRKKSISCDILSHWKGWRLLLMKKEQKSYFCF